MHCLQSSSSTEWLSFKPTGPEPSVVPLTKQPDSNALIFSHLDAPGLCAVSRVSKAWRADLLQAMSAPTKEPVFNIPALFPQLNVIGPKEWKITLKKSEKCLESIENLQLERESETLVKTLSVVRSLLDTLANSIKEQEAPMSQLEVIRRLIVFVHLPLKEEFLPVDPGTSVKKRATVLTIPAGWSSNGLKALLKVFKAFQPESKRLQEEGRSYDWHFFKEMITFVGEGQSAEDIVTKKTYKVALTHSILKGSGSSFLEERGCTLPDKLAIETLVVLTYLSSGQVLFPMEVSTHCFNPVTEKSETAGGYPARVDHFFALSPVNDHYRINSQTGQAAQMRL